MKSPKPGHTWAKPDTQVKTINVITLVVPGHLGGEVADPYLNKPLCNEKVTK